MYARSLSVSRRLNVRRERTQDAALDEAVQPRLEAAVAVPVRHDLAVEGVQENRVHEQQQQTRTLTRSSHVAYFY